MRSTVSVALTFTVGLGALCHARPPQVYHIPSLLPGGAGNSEAQGVSADGSVVVGSAASPNTPNKEAYRWTIAAGIEPASWRGSSPPSARAGRTGCGAGRCRSARST